MTMPVMLGQARTGRSDMTMALLLASCLSAAGQSSLVTAIRLAMLDQSEVLPVLAFRSCFSEC
jgi:hypothetical protein